MTWVVQEKNTIVLLLFFNTSAPASIERSKDTELIILMKYSEVN